jgi:hypothetical protein
MSAQAMSARVNDSRTIGGGPLPTRRDPVSLREREALPMTRRSGCAHVEPIALVVDRAR